MKPDGPNETRWPTRFRDSAAPEAQRAGELVRQMGDVPPLSANELARGSMRLLDRLPAERRVARSRLPFALALGAAFLIGAIGSRLWSAHTSSPSIARRAPSTEPAPRPPNVAMAELVLDGSKAVVTGPARVVVDRAGRVVLVPSGGEAAIEVSSSQVTVAAFRGGARLEGFDEHTIALVAGQQFRAGHVEPIAPTKAAITPGKASTIAPAAESAVVVSHDEPASRTGSRRATSRRTPIADTAPEATPPKTTTPKTTGPKTTVPKTTVPKTTVPKTTVIVQLDRAVAPNEASPPAQSPSPPATTPLEASPSPMTRAPAVSPPRPPSDLAEESRLLAEALRELRSAHDPNAALATLSRYEARFPHGQLHPEADRTRVDALLKSHRSGQALALLDRLDESTLGETEQRVTRGELRAAAHRYEEAIADFDVAVAHAHGAALARALYGRGVSRAKRSDVAGARRDFERYLAEFPDGELAKPARRALAP